MLRLPETSLPPCSPGSSCFGGALVRVPLLDLCLQPVKPNAVLGSSDGSCPEPCRFPPACLPTSSGAHRKGGRTATSQVCDLRARCSPARPRPSDPEAPLAPGVQKGPGGKRHRGPPTILPGAPQLLAGPAVCAGGPAASRSSPATQSSSSKSAPGTHAPGGAQGRWRQVLLTELQLPACTNSPGSQPDPGPAPFTPLPNSDTHSALGDRRDLHAPPSLPPTPKCKGHPGVDSPQARPPPTNPIVHYAARGPTVFGYPLPSYKSRRAPRLPGADGIHALPS